MSAHPDLVRPLDGKSAQEIGEYLVSGRRLGRPWLRSERRNPHLAHQPPHPLAIDRMALRPQQRGHPPRTEERPGGEQLVDPPLQRQIVIIVGGRRRSMHAGARHAE